MMCNSKISGTILIILINFIPSFLALDNGLALTPPMGWLAWERFRCNVDCLYDAENCVSERLFMEMADAMVSEGYADVGYEYIILDDCWMAKERDSKGKLQGDPVRFPNGIKALGEYVHSKGLKFGIYEDYGTKTCGGYPGILGHLEKDAKTFAEWGADYIKLDGCYADPFDMDDGYMEFGRHLNATGRNMIYSCSWPDYQIYAGMDPNYTLIMDTCHLWRNFDDIQDSWSSVETIIDFYGRNQNQFIPLAGPGHWTDPDMLIVGNYGLSYDQSVTQMSLWALMAAPLLMSNDLRSTKAEFKSILQNRKVIAINQDKLGMQGRRIHKAYGIEIWRRPIRPTVKLHGTHHYSYGIAFVNRRTDGLHSKLISNVEKMGLKHPGGYKVEDLFTGKNYGILHPRSNLTLFVNPTGTVFLHFVLQSTD